MELCRVVRSQAIAKYYSANHNLNTWKKAKMSGGDSIKLQSRKNPIIKTLDTPEFRAIFSPELEKIIHTFKFHNYEIRLAGGPVR